MRDPTAGVLPPWVCPPCRRGEHQATYHLAGRPDVTVCHCAVCDAGCACGQPHCPGCRRGGAIWHRAQRIEAVRAGRRRFVWWDGTLWFRAAGRYRTLRCREAEPWYLAGRMEGKLSWEL